MDLGDYNPGQWEWKPPTTTTTETTFIETSPIQEPLSGDFKVRNGYMAQSRVIPANPGQFQMSFLF